jgi:cell division protein FtsQ
MPSETRIDHGGPPDAEDPSSPDQPMRARDVWRAARARRRALRAEVRRFTARQRHRRMVWWGAAAALVLLVLGSVAAAYSPLFAVERVRVVGLSELDAATVESALSSQLGRPLPAVDSSEVKAALVAFPLVESYTLEARPPHDLVVRIVERTPIGVLKSSAGYTLVDAAGVALDTTDERPSDRPLITVAGGVGSAAFGAVGRVYRSLPDDIRQQVTAMKATTANDVTLRLGDTDTDVVWGSATASAEKAVVLEKIMKTRPPSEVSRYDVSSPTAVVVR